MELASQGWFLGIEPVSCSHIHPWYTNMSQHTTLCACDLSLSNVPVFGTPWTRDIQAPLSKEFSRQEYWSRLPFPTPGDLPNPRISLIYGILKKKKKKNELIETENRSVVARTFGWHVGEMDESDEKALFSCYN